MELIVHRSRTQVSGYSITIPSVQEKLQVSHELAALGVTFFTLTFGVSSTLSSTTSSDAATRRLTCLTPAVLVLAGCATRPLAALRGFRPEPVRTQWPGLRTRVADLIGGFAADTGSVHCSIYLISAFMATIWLIPQAL